MRKQQFDEKLAQLKKIASGPMSEESTGVLRELLRGSHGLLASMAAQVVGRRGVSELAPELVQAYQRFHDDSDKVCQVKMAVVTALQRLDYPGDEVYLHGVKHVQMEPAFGGPIDTAADLRAACAVALANMYHRDARLILTSMLVDPEINPRRAAVKALGHLGREASECLIRLKALSGDSELTITGDCLTVLMEMAPESSIDFVAGFLGKPDPQIVEQAALALGQSHDEHASQVLRDAWAQNPSPEFRQLLLLPIALLRRDDAFEFLLELVGHSSPKLAAGALNALSLYADDASRRRIREVVEARGDLAVTEAFRKEFGS